MNVYMLSMPYNVHRHAYTMCIFYTDKCRNQTCTHIPYELMCTIIQYRYTNNMCTYMCTIHCTDRRITCVNIPYVYHTLCRYMYSKCTQNTFCASCIVHIDV